MATKFLKPGKVAIITRGRFAGKKVVIIKPHDDGSKSHPFGHAVVAGIERYPQTVTDKHSAKKAARRNRIKPFIKVVNYNHMMPTRYSLEIDSVKDVVSADTLKEPSQKTEAKKEVRKAFEERFQTGKNAWFFTKLAF